MKKRILAIVIACCAIVLAFGLAACGGSSSGSAASGSGSAASSSSDDAQAKAEADAQAALEEGIGYWYGTGTNGYDKEKARAAFQKAAENGNAEGWYWLGDLMSHDPIAERWPQVMSYYQKAADNGCAKGYYGLGRLYETGYGVEKDAAKATELYQKAVDAGELQGYIGLGGLYQSGASVEASGTKAAELYEKATASEDFVTRNAARFALGQLYRVGAEGLGVDATKATDYYQKAADENYRDGWRGLGLMYSSNSDKGNADSETNASKAFECKSKEAALGSPFNLGVEYEIGEGCDQDYAKSIELYKQEAESGPRAANGMYAMSTMAVNGWGMERDLAVAADWCHKALDAAGPDDSYVIEKATERLEQIENNS